MKRNRKKQYSGRIGIRNKRRNMEIKVSIILYIISIKRRPERF